MTASGRPSRATIAAATVSRATTVPTAPVLATSRSAVASSSASASSGACRAGVPVRRVFSTSRWARSAERLSTTISCAPARRRWAAVSAPIAPAPTTTARTPRRSPSVWAATASASETTEAPAASIPVRVCTRLPTRSACCDSSCSVRPTVPAVSAAAYAARSWPRICASPMTIESSPAATANRCWTADPA